MWPEVEREDFKVFLHTLKNINKEEMKGLTGN
jgi:hypothetical protein